MTLGKFMINIDSAESKYTPSRYEDDDNSGFMIISVFVWITTFFYIWVDLFQTYDGFYVLLFGWIPAILGACITSFLWPLAVIVGVPLIGLSLVFT